MHTNKHSTLYTSYHHKKTKYTQLCAPAEEATAGNVNASVQMSIISRCNGYDACLYALDVSV